MMRIQCRAGLVVWLAGVCIAPPPAAAQQPPTDGVVSVRPADGGGRGARGGLADGEALGFVTGEFAGETRVLASVADIDPSQTQFVVRADGHDHNARLLDRDLDTGLAVFAVPELTAPPFLFARDPAAEGRDIFAAVLNVRDGVTFVPGRVEEIEPGAAGGDPGAVRHDAFNAFRRNAGAPLTNECGQIIGAVRRNPDTALVGSDNAVPAEWLRTRFANGLREAVADTACDPPDPPPDPAAPDPAAPDPTAPDPAAPDPTAPDPTAPDPAAPDPAAPDPAAPDPAAPDPAAPDPATPDSEAVEDALRLSREERQRIQRGLAAAGFDPGALDGVFGPGTRDAIEAWQIATGVEPTRYLDAPAADVLERAGLLDELEDTQEVLEDREEVIEDMQGDLTDAQDELDDAQEELTDAQQQQAADRTRYLRWIAGALVGGAAIALLLWVASRRSVARARRARAKAEGAAQSAQSNLAALHARDQMASAVPSVFLDGADREGHPIALRIPGKTIAAPDGAVVGRNPFDATVVIDHTEVSRRHFRLSALGTTVLIEDLNSTNGTSLNDVPLVPGSGEALQTGAVVKVGSLILKVTLQA